MSQNMANQTEFDESVHTLSVLEFNTFQKEIPLLLNMNFPRHDRRVFAAGPSDLIRTTIIPLSYSLGYIGLMLISLKTLNYGRYQKSSPIIPNTSCNISQFTNTIRGMFSKRENSLLLSQIFTDSLAK